MKERVTIQTCDNPQCGEWFIDSREEPAPGYHLGSGFWCMGGGGPIPATYACSVDCIAPGIRHNIERGA